jgi:hypothetical protein
MTDWNPRRTDVQPFSVRKRVTRQRAYAYTARTIATALGLDPAPEEWVVIEVDEETVDVLIREDISDDRH